MSELSFVLEWTLIKNSDILKMKLKTETFENQKRGTESFTLPHSQNSIKMYFLGKKSFTFVSVVPALFPVTIYVFW